MDLPNSWTFANIGEVCSLDNGRGFKSSEWSRTGKPIIRIQNLNNSNAPFNYYDGEPLPEKFQVKTGDLLFAWSGTPGTSFGAHVWKGPEAYLNQHIFNVRFSEKFLDKRFFKMAFNQQLHLLIEGAHGGVGLRHVTKGKLNETPFPLPPLAEQKRIVTKIEELFSELDAGDESFKLARKQLGIYRQSLLKQAFEGKLTEAWRKANPDQLEDPDQLLARIQQERESRHQQQLSDWQQAVEQWEQNGKEGKKPAKPRKPKEQEPLEKEVLETLPSIPDCWMWLPLKGGNVEIADGPFGSNLKTSDYVTSGIQVIRLENIGAGKFIGSKQSFISEEKYEQLKKHTVYPGDLVFASFVTESVRCTIVPPSVEVSVNKADCFRVREYANTLNPDYLNNCFAARYFYKHLEGLIHGVGRPRINTTQLGEAPIPLCSIPEQQEIARLLEEQFTVIEQNEREIDAALKRSEALRQSILKRAFSGQLVPQDPTDEPASQLLARIQAERTAQEAATKTTKKAKKKTAKKKTARKRAKKS